MSLISWSRYASGRITSTTKYGPSLGGANLCLSLCALSIGLSHLLGRPEGEPSGCGIVRVFAGTLPIW
jgi:hypothetical protein